MLHVRGLTDWGLEELQAHVAVVVASGEEECEVMGRGCYHLSLVVG